MAKRGRNSQVRDVPPVVACSRAKSINSLSHSARFARLFSRFQGRTAAGKTAPLRCAVSSPATVLYLKRTLVDVEDAAMNWELWILPVIGAAIGYATNVVAIKMLFRPRRPLRIRGTPIVIQGLLPKRKKELAANVARVVQDELLPLAKVESLLADGGYKEEVLELLVSHVERRAAANLPTFLPSSMKDGIADYAGDVVRREARPFLDTLYAQISKKLENDFVIGEMVEKQMDALDLEHLERLVLQLAKEELKHIELLGAVLGLLIGLAQMAFLQLKLF